MPEIDNLPDPLPAIRDDCRRLMALLDDPQLGLWSWSRLLVQALTQLRRDIDDALKEDGDA